jgi:hypothetical protein
MMIILSPAVMHECGTDGSCGSYKSGGGESKITLSNTVGCPTRSRLNQLFLH